jgi:hypothetical protein
MKTKLGGFVASATFALVAATPVAAQPARQVKFAPYIEAAQVLSADVKGGDVLTYTQVSVGIDASTVSRRITATISARYDRNFSYQKKVNDTNVVTGLAKVSAAVVPGVTIDGGAIATRARSDIRGAAPGFNQGNLGNTSQVVSADIGPSVAGHAGPVGLAASYRFGGTEVSTPSAKGVPAGSRPLDNYSSSQRHTITASAGVKPGHGLPVGVSASGAYEREDASQLDQKYEGYYGRGDVVVPITPTIAVTGGAGYEKIEISQRDPIVNGAGVPVTNAQGRFVYSSTAPRRIAFNTTGLFWDAGVLYRPSPRTTFQARVGKRYDTMSYTGSLQWQASSAIGFNVGVYDGIQSFGRQLRAGVASIPNAFVASGDPLSQNFTGCTFGQSSAEAGGCLNSAFQSITTANYRARGVDAVMIARRGGTSFGFGGGYSNRKFLVPDTGPNLTVTDNSRDQSAYLQAFASQALSPNSGVDFNANAQWFNSGVPGADNVYTVGASGGYYHRFGNLGASASVGVTGYDSKSIDAQVAAQARLGLRYGF